MIARRMNDYWFLQQVRDEDLFCMSFMGGDEEILIGPASQLHEVWRLRQIEFLKLGLAVSRPSQ